jgi:hypothetical protein
MPEKSRVSVLDSLDQITECRTFPNCVFHNFTRPGYSGHRKDQVQPFRSEDARLRRGSNSSKFTKLKMVGCVVEC